MHVCVTADLSHCSHSQVEQSASEGEQARSSQLSLEQEVNYLCISCELKRLKNLGLFCPDTAPFSFVRCVLGVYTFILLASESIG